MVLVIDPSKYTERENAFIAGVLLGVQLDVNPKDERRIEKLIEMWINVFRNTHSTEREEKTGE